MCFDLQMTAPAIIRAMTVAKLANVQTVGIGLYLALGVIQAVSSGGVAGLERRSNALQRAVAASKLAGLYPSLRDIRFELSRLENGFHGLNRTLLVISAILFIISTAYFSYCTLFQDYLAGALGTWFIMVYYLALPIVIFLLSSLAISLRCRDVADRIKKVEDAVFVKSLAP